MGDTHCEGEGGGGGGAPLVLTKLPIFIVFTANFWEVSGHLIRFYLTFLSLF